MSDDDKDKPTMSPTTAKELIAIHDTLDDNAFRWALTRLPEHEKDLLVPCPNGLCLAAEGEECKGTNRRERRTHKAGRRAVNFDPAKLVHFGRRVKRLLKGIR